MSACNNDVNVVEASCSYKKIFSGQYAPAVEYRSAAELCTIPYLFADGIYPMYPLFEQQVLVLVINMEKLLARTQEGSRKYSERVFEVFHATVHILSRPSRLLCKVNMDIILKTYALFHNIKMNLS